MPNNPPNILLLMCDQLRKDALGCYGNSVVQTPNIDALAAEGVRFERMYAAYPVCAPNRASIITGRYELVFEKPDLPPDQHVIRVKLTPEARERLVREKRKPLLFFREAYDDRPTVPETFEPAHP